MPSDQNHLQLLHRHAGNPLLTAADWPYQVNTVFNPAATKLQDGSTLLLCRVEDKRGISHLSAARSANGIDNWIIDTEPTLFPDPANYPEEEWGLEDPRITYLADLDKYGIAFTAYSKEGATVALALTKDFRKFERLGPVTIPRNKDAALMPEKINGKWALITRPMDGGHSANIWISYSENLTHWGNHKMILHARKGGWWDANKIGLSPPLIKTEKGWLMLYHGVRVTASGSLYRVGLALFDLNDPARLLLRGNEWIFGPDEPYELAGDVGTVVFPCGYTLGSDGDTLNLYYGGADSCIALAQGSIKQLLAWLKEHGTVE